MERYSTITEAPSRTVLVHVVQVKVIAPSGSSLTTYALLDSGGSGGSGFEFLPTMSDEEKIEKWKASFANKNKKPKHDPEQGGKKEPLGEGYKTPKNEAQRDKPVFEGNQTSAILLSQQCFRGCTLLNSQETQVITQPSQTDFETIWRMESSMIVRN